MFFFRGLIFLLLLVSLVACTGAPPTVKRYMLETMPAQPSTEGPHKVVGLGKISMPAYLDRPQIMRRKGNRVLLAENQLWAESLVDAVPRTLVINMSHFLPQIEFVQQLSSNWSRPEWKVFLRVDRLDAVDDRAVEMEARWSITDAKGKTVLNNRVMLEEPIVNADLTNDDWSPIVDAHGKLLTALAKVISEDVKALIGH